MDIDIWDAKLQTISWRRVWKQGTPKSSTGLVPHVSLFFDCNVDPCWKYIPFSDTSKWWNMCHEHLEFGRQTWIVRVKTPNGDSLLTRSPEFKSMISSMLRPWEGGLSWSDSFRTSAHKFWSFLHPPEMLRVIAHSSKPPLLPAAKWIHVGNSESSAK